MLLNEKIEINPEIMVGKPVIKGTRITVEFILNLLSNGETVESIVGEYSNLSREDIYACLFFAKKILE